MQCTIRKHFDYLTPLSEAENDNELRQIATLKYAKACANLNTDARFFADTVDEIRKYSAWRVVGCESLEEFCETKLGRTLEAVEQLISGVRSLQAVGVTKPTAAQAMAAAPKLAGHGEIGNGRSRGDVVTSTDRGNRSSYLAARIRRDHPAIAKRVEAGEFRSIRAAAIEAGIVRKTITIEPTVNGFVKAIANAACKYAVVEALVADLSGDERQHLRTLIDDPAFRAAN